MNRFHVDGEDEAQAGFKFTTYTIQDDLDGLSNLLLPLPECWDYTCASACLVYALL